MTFQEMDDALIRAAIALAGTAANQNVPQHALRLANAAALLAHAAKGTPGGGALTTSGTEH